MYNNANDFIDIDEKENIDSKHINIDKEIIENKSKIDQIKKKDINKEKDNQNICEVKTEIQNNYLTDINNNNISQNNIIESLRDRIPDSKPIYLDGFKYVIYTPTKTFEKANKITYICNLNKKNVNNKRGEKRFCYGSISYIKSEKIWVYNRYHSDYCNEYYKNIHKENKSDNSANFKEERELITEYLNEHYKKNPNISISEFNEIANIYYKENNLTFTIFKDT